eukprot:1857291-Rhodomonas_salina.1
MGAGPGGRDKGRHQAPCQVAADSDASREAVQQRASRVFSTGLNGRARRPSESRVAGGGVWRDSLCIATALFFLFEEEV